MLVQSNTSLSLLLPSSASASSANSVPSPSLRRHNRPTHSYDQTMFIQPLLGLHIISSLFNPLAAFTKVPSTPATMLKQQATRLKERSTLSKQYSTLLPKTATVSNEFIVKFRPFDTVECCFDIVAVFENSVEATFDFGERIVRLAAFDNVGLRLRCWC